MKPLVLAAVSLSLAAPAAALSPEAQAFIETLNPKPTAQAVAIAESHGEIKTTFMDEEVSYSVESLARERKKNGLVRFITTRLFIHGLRKDGRFTGFPDLYEAIYLTTAERDFVGKKVAESYLRG